MHTQVRLNTTTRKQDTEGLECPGLVCGQRSQLLLKVTKLQQTVHSRHVQHIRTIVINFCLTHPHIIIAQVLR